MPISQIPGSVATPFESRHIAQELALCKRYCQEYGLNEPYSILGGLNGTNRIRISFVLPVVMRSSPSLIRNGTPNIYSYLGAVPTMGTLADTYLSRGLVSIDYNVSGGTVVAGAVMELRYSGSNNFILDAEL